MAQQTWKVIKREVIYVLCDLNIFGQAFQDWKCLHLIEFASYVILKKFDGRGCDIPILNGTTTGAGVTIYFVLGAYKFFNVRKPDKDLIPNNSVPYIANSVLMQIDGKNRSTLDCFGLLFDITKATTWH